MNQNPSSPPTFQDLSKRTWTIKLTVGAVDRVEAETQFQLLPEGLDTTALTGLLFDDRKLASVLWSCCRPLDDSVSRESFMDSLDADALSKGWGAMVDAVVFFTQAKSPTMAEALRKSMEKQMEVMEQGANGLLKTLNSEGTNLAMSKKMTELEVEMQSVMEKELDSIALNSPELSE